jgi:hypothetical protein
VGTPPVLALVLDVAADVVADDVAPASVSPLPTLEVLGVPLLTPVAVVTPVALARPVLLLVPIGGRLMPVSATMTGPLPPLSVVAPPSTGVDPDPPLAHPPTSKHANAT